MTRNKIFVLILIIISLGCKKKFTTTVKPNFTISKATTAPVNYTILSNSAIFFPLNTIGGSTYVPYIDPSTGIKGIIIYRISQTQFIAFERSCTYDGCDNLKSMVWSQTGSTTCKDSICGSIFNLLDGTVQKGPANIPLYQYHINWNGSQLNISN